MVEVEHNEDRGTRGIAIGGLTTGIIGSALGLLNGNGGLGGILGGGGNRCNEDHYVNRYEIDLMNQLAAKDGRISLLESNIYTDSKIADVYERLNTKIAAVESQLCTQAVYNATNTAALNCMQGQIATLMALTKTVVPNSSICPGWGNVTVAPATTTTG